jgi:hypothetical protein
MQGAFLQIVCMFLIMALALYVRKRGYFSPEAITQINKFTIHILFPALFFVQIVAMDIVAVFHLRFILAALAVLVLTYFLS